MDYWFYTESRMRRNEILEFARRRRQARLCESTRSPRLRTRALRLLRLVLGRS